jgi:predicted nucleotide-binding protein
MEKITRKLFIGCSSSKQTKLTAGLIKTCILELQSSEFDIDFILDPVIWDEDRELKKGALLINSIITLPERFHYGIFIVTNDDNEPLIKSRLNDNVLIELGIFLSREDGLEKSFVIQPENSEILLPTDLQGLIVKKIPFGEVTDALFRHRIVEIVKLIIEKINDFELKIAKESRDAYLHQMDFVKRQLSSARGKSSDQKVHIIMDSLKQLIDTKAKAMHQITRFSFCPTGKK